MLTLNERIELLDKLGKYMISNDMEWEEAKVKARLGNSWFTDESINTAVKNIAEEYLQKEKLDAWVAQYKVPSEQRLVGIIMAGNIPLVGMHDFICGFISGHKLSLKLSSKDNLLLNHLIHKLVEWHPGLNNHINITDTLKGCDAYIMTGNNNSARYFEYYFGKYPNIIRKNRTSVAILDGAETEKDLQNLNKDIFTYYGLGCRNISKLYIPEGYDMQQILKSTESYKHVFQHHKYKNNFDYNLAIYLLNKEPYLTNEVLILRESKDIFSPISVINYEFYTVKKSLENSLHKNDNVQCIVGMSNIPFGEAQTPSLNSYADNVDTMLFLSEL